MTLTRNARAAVIVLLSTLINLSFAEAELPRLDFATLTPTPEEVFPGPEPAQPPATLLFGYAVAVHGNTALVSMPEASPPRIALFTRTSSGEWQRTGTLQSEPVSLLALHGNHALAASGSAITAYRRTHRGWIRTQTLPLDASPTSLAVDGRIAAYITNAPDQNASVQVLYLDHRKRWLRGPTLTNRDGGEWGSSLALSNDTIVVGAATQDEQRGAAYVFRRVGWWWHEQQKLLPPDEQALAFGAAVGVHRERIAIGAPGTLPFNELSGQLTGAVYVFNRKGRFWHERERLQPTIEEWNGTGNFGAFLALTGSILAVVSPAPDRFQNAEVFVYRPTGPHHSYLPSGLLVFDSFAGITAIDAWRNTVLTGIPFDSPFNTGFVASFAAPLPEQAAEH